ncbi:LexA family transcriptional regulator [Arhodomonas sp. AD133]|uniref:LexA family transcriptional regulator n=1 Tax=Arhodomonas sp. AD133 TaxID=3415009 RepID=UPI003EBB90EF
MVMARTLSPDQREAARRLRQLWDRKRHSLGLTQESAGERMGMTQGAVGQYLNGRIPLNPKATLQFARLLGVHPTEIDPSSDLWPEGSWQQDASAKAQTSEAAGPVAPIITWENPEDLPQDQYVLVERRRVKPSAGEGALIFEEEQAPPLAFTTSWIKREGLKRHNLVIVGASGDSMEPTIHDGDSLMVDLGQTEVVDGLVYVLRYGGELRIKRLFRRYDGALIVRSDNSAKYPEEVIPPEHLDGQVQVIGRVVWRAGGVS